MLKKRMNNLFFCWIKKEKIEWVDGRVTTPFFYPFAGEIREGYLSQQPWIYHKMFHHYNSKSKKK